MLHEDFLPPEYVEHRADRRMQAFGMGLFLIVVASVSIAFMAKRSDWQRVSAIRDQVTVRYEAAGQEVAVITALEERQSRIHERARIAASLVERLPRSVLLSEFINRMPPGLGLLEFDLHTVQVKAPAPKTAKGRAGRARKKLGDAEALPKAPTYRTQVSMLGFAPTDLQVSDFLAELNAHVLFEDVALMFSEETQLNGMDVRQFRVTCSLGPDADIRNITPRRAPRTIGAPLAGVEFNR